MKTVRLQQDLLKDLLNINTKIRNIVFAEDADKENSIMFTYDSNVIYKLWNFETMIDIEKIKKLYGVGITNRVHAITEFYDENKATPAALSGVQKVETVGKKKFTYLEVKSKDGEKTAWINEYKLKYFENPTFKIVNDVSPLGVYEGNWFRGVLCPCRVK